jgi:amino acid transporter
VSTKHEDDRAAAEALGRMGYAQELLRSMGGFSSFALSFSIISVLTGVVTSYDVGLTNGGPAGLGIGWPVVCVGTLLVALAMAELASAFPTAGALYHWSAILGGPGWGWVVAMINIIGQIAIVAAIDYGCAKTLAPTVGLGTSAILPLFCAIALSHGALNALSIKLVGRLNDFSATVHIVGVALLVGLLLAFGRAQPISFLAQTGFTTRDDHNYVLGFANALALGMWTMTGFDASAHTAEETHDPARRAPWGIVSAVLVSAVAGYALLCAITLAIHDLPEIAATPQPALAIMRHALGERAGSIAMGAAIVAMWFCGLSSVTSLSRTVFAFSRDGGLPFSSALRRVSERHKSPIVAVAFATALPSLLVFALSWQDNVFLAVTSLATTALYVSYALPIALGVVSRVRGRWHKFGPFHLRSFGLPIAILAVIWSLAVVIVFALPPNVTFGVVIVGVVAVVVLAYPIVIRGRFQGPRVHLDDIER